MNERETIQEVSMQEGYAHWAASYDQEDNALIAVEEAYVDPILAQLSAKRVLDIGTGKGIFLMNYFMDMKINCFV